MKLSSLLEVCNIDIDDYISFRESVRTGLVNKDWLGDLTRDDIEYLLVNNALIWIYYDNDIKVCSMMLIRMSKEEINDIGLSCDYNKVVDYGPIFVRDNYRGNKLQYQMLKRLDKYSKDLGMKYAIITVDPNNNYSINNIILDGFDYYKTMKFDRGTRNIYIKDLIKEK